jgi:hypothetical protein
MSARPKKIIQQAAVLSSLRDAARTLCEKLQHVERDDFHGEFLKLVIEIEESEKVLPSIGLCTSLQPSEKLVGLKAGSLRRKTLIDTLNATFTPQGDAALVKLSKLK